MITFWIIIAFVFIVVISVGVYFGIQLGQLHTKSDKEKVDMFMKKMVKKHGYTS